MLATTACLKKTFKPAIGAGQQPLPSTVAGLRATFEKDALSETNSVVSKEQFVGKLLDASHTKSAETEQVAEERKRRKLEWAVNKNLEYLQDRWKVAKHVEATLKKDRFEEALLLTQRASKNDQCVVAWNHLIDHVLNVQKRLNLAIKLFNDMKKRGQLPNEQTYTIIFRGCVDALDPQAAVTKAVNLYHTLLKDERVKANGIHLNAVLQVCGRAGDIDSLFSIAGTADAKAGRRADARTYTTIINSLRFKVQPKWDVETPKQKPAGDAAKEIQQVVDQCKAIWDEVVREWRNGKLKLDEDLVCAMGCVLLLEDSNGNTEVFALLEDVMGVPSSDTVESIKKSPDETMKNIAVSGHKSPKKVPDSKNATYVVPGQKTLSLILTAAREHGAGKQNKISSAYWRLFTEHYGLKPDADNYNSYMKQRERAGASAGAKNLLTQMPAKYVTSPLIHRALQACLRDNMNPAVFQTATDVLHKMLQGMEALKEETGRGQRIDLLALLLYHRVAQAADHSFRQMIKKGDSDGGNRGYGKQLATAINELWSPFLNARSALKVMSKSRSKAKPSTADWIKRHKAFEKSLLELARNMIATVDRIEKGNMLDNDPELLEEIKQKRNTINRFVVELTDPQQQVS
ncbi:pentatricopeptide repeat domain-containing protein [Colletotrichum karsti]|uniref:Pentatricopeptide repeat domain-containing protein n=1 Tax=Colletotrichum karsti TaxID=1095194 RepID=A0A9P6LGV4_9PEZI|nr:pentatricopeptide repeat domain-containing protein [Colletotrichum karsti]KAF9875624.1 pentatricopeptide repeat domain-containing protein [Colletotrichum karsti]